MALNEFDVNFHKILHKTEDTTGCMKFHDATGFDYGKLYSCDTKIYHSRNFWLDLIALFFDFLLILSFICIDEPVDENGLKIAALTFCILVNIIFSIVHFATFADGCDPIGTQYVSFVNSDGTVTTTIENRYSDGNTASEVFAVFFTIVCPFHFIYLLCRHARAKAKFNEICPSEIRNAYMKAKEQTRRYKISQSKRIKITKKKEAYDERIKQFKQHFSILGQQKLQQKIDSVELPYLTLYGTHILFEDDLTYYDNGFSGYGYHIGKCDNSYLLYKANDGVHILIVDNDGYAAFNTVSDEIKDKANKLSLRIYQQPVKII